MAAPDYPITAGIRLLRGKGINFVAHQFTYEEHGGTKHSARTLGVDEHGVIKTLVMETDRGDPFIVLMHGDADVSTKSMARILGVKHVQPCDARTAERHTGYVFGGTSPFGTRRSLPVYAEKSIFDLEKIYINGGKRGLLVSMDPKSLRACFSVTEVDAAISKDT